MAGSSETTDSINHLSPNDEEFSKYGYEPYEPYSVMPRLIFNSVNKIPSFLLFLS